MEDLISKNFVKDVEQLFYKLVSTRNEF